MEGIASAPFSSQHSGAGVGFQGVRQEEQDFRSYNREVVQQEDCLQGKSSVQRDWESAGLDPPLSIQSPVQDQNAPSALAASKMGL